MAEKDLGKILAFHELVLGRDDDYKKEKATEFDIDFDEYKRRIIGKERELEFLIIMRSLKSISHLVAYDESLSHVTNEFTSDFEITFSDGYQMMLEIKSTHESAKRIISGGNFEKRESFAKSKNLPLRFAVCLNGLWGVFTADYLKSKNFTLDITDTMNENGEMKSWLHSEFGTCNYLFKDKLEIISVYDKTAHSGLGIFYDGFGEMVEYRILQSGREILRCDKNNKEYLFVSMCIEALQDELSKSHHDVYANKNRTKIIEFNSKPSLLIPEYSFILSRIRHIINKNNTNNDNIFFAAKSHEEEFEKFSVAYIRYALSVLVEHGLKLFVERNGMIFTFEKFAKTFWKR